MVLRMVTSVQNATSNSGDPFGPGSTLQSPLRSDFRCDPCRLRSLRSLRAPLARKADTPCRHSGHGARQHPHFVRRRCRLRRAPGSAPRRATLSARVRTRLPSPPAACCARLPAALAAPPATQSPWRLHSAGFADTDSPIVHTAGFAVPYRPGRLWIHTRRIVDAWCAMAAHGCDRLRLIMIVRTKVRV